MTLNKTNSITILLLSVVVLAAAVFTWQIVTNNKKENTIEAPALQALKTTADQSPYTDLDGKAVGLTSYIGEVLVVSSWASWCPSCVDSLKELSELSNLYGSEVKILAINRSDPVNIAKAFLKTYEISDDVQLVLDEDDRYFKSIEGYNMPETIIYDPSGNEVFHKHGVTSVAELKIKIDETLIKSDKD